MCSLLYSSEVMSPAAAMRSVLLASLCVCLALGLPAEQNVPEVTAWTGSDCPLQCTAEPKPGVRYRAVRWYKVGEPPESRLNGLLARDLPNGTTRWYTNLDREVELLGETRDIFLPNVTCGDSGVYICHLAAPVGEQNREGRVLLTLTDCPDEAEENLVRDAYMVIIATIVLMFALVIFRMSYMSLKNAIRDRNKTTKQETLLNGPLKPLEKKDLMLIYTLGPKQAPSLKHVCV